jgi:tripartite-type tricarboxylate transporter receptor subunit TctC
MRAMRRRVVLAGLAAPALAGIAGRAAAQGSGFYRDKVVNINVAGGASGGHTRYARLIQPYLQKHLGAREVRITNMPGGGGLKAANYIYRVKPDGLQIFFGNVSTLILAPLAGSPGANFEPNKLIYLGRATSEPRVLCVGGKSSIKSIQDVQKLKRPFVYPSQGTDEDFYTMAVLGDALGFQIKAVTGYEGNADTSLAVIKGEADGHMTSWTASKPAVEAGEKRIVLVIAPERVPDLPDVPNAAELVQDPKQKAALAAVTDIIGMSRGFFGPANMDPAATKEMRAAIEAALKDPELLAEATKKRLPIVFASGEDLQKKVQSVVTSGADLKAPLAAALQSIK